MHVNKKKKKTTTFERTSYTDSNRQVKTQKKEQKRGKKKNQPVFPLLLQQRHSRQNRLKTNRLKVRTMAQAAEEAEEEYEICCSRLDLH